ncbi:MAG: GNAT family N-acetyltransferase [Candidatus Micrarchaeota archaeon]
MAGELKVRKLSKKEAEGFKIRVFRKYFRKLYGKKSGRLLEAFETKTVWLGGVIGRRLVGVMRVEIEAGRCKIGMLAIEPAFWRRGVGSVLLAEAEKIGKRLGCVKAWLMTKPGWHAHEFYKKNGYRTEAVLDAYFNGSKGVLMSKRLKGSVKA